MSESESKLPVAPILKPHRLDAYQFSNYSDPRYSFGADKEKVAAALRETADKIESGEYVLQSCGIFTRAHIEDYAMTYLTLEFHAKKVE